MKIALMVDSGADISAQEAQELNIHVIRMPLMIDDKQYIEEDEINMVQFIEKMKQGAICKTSQPSIGNLMEMFEKLLNDNDHIIYLPLSSKLSGTYGTALQASKDFDGKVTVINAKHIAYVSTLLALEIRKMIENGKTPEEIKTIVETNSEMWACILPDDLVYLKRGGRISPVAATLGNLLKIVPILKVEDGAIDVHDKVRTRKKALTVALESVTKDVAANDYYWFVLHADCLDDALQTATSLESLINETVIVKPLRSVIMAHTGPNTIGVGRMKKVA